jgi:hypothetical protein
MDARRKRAASMIGFTPALAFSTPWLGRCRRCVHIAQGQSRFEALAVPSGRIPSGHRVKNGYH